MVLAILQLDGMEIRTTDEVCVRTLWGLMSTAVKPDDARVLDGRHLPGSTDTEDR